LQYNIGEVADELDMEEEKVLLVIRKALIAKTLKLRGMPAGPAAEPEQAPPNPDDLPGSVK
jgi:hypothetical protein